MPPKKQKGKTKVVDVVEQAPDKKEDDAWLDDAAELDINAEELPKEPTPQPTRISLSKEEELPSDQEETKTSNVFSDSVGEWIQDFHFLESNLIFNSEFFVLEIARLKTKYDFDEQRKEIDIKKKDLSVPELIRIAEMNERFCSEFGDKFEYEWARLLIQNALSLRREIFERLNPGNVDRD